MGPGAVFSRSFASLFISATDSELEPIDRALRACDDAYASDPLVRHCAGRLSQCAARLGEFAERIGRDCGGRIGCEEPQYGLAAGALAKAGVRFPPRATLFDLEKRVIESVRGQPGLDPAQQLAVAVAQLRRTRLDRAAYWGLEVSIENRKTKMSESGNSEHILKSLIELLNKIDIINVFSKNKKEFGRVNILIAGQTGAGKSSLINAIFGEDVAKVGVGRPVTENIEWFSPPNLPVQLCDTRGLELKDFAETLAALEKEVARRSEIGDATERVHILWLCISGRQTRVQADAEGKVLELCRKYEIPGIVVVTQSTDRMSVKIEAEARMLLPGAADFVRVLAQLWDDSDPPVQPFGLQQLVDVTAKLIPQVARQAFVAAQRVDLKKKRTEAFGIARTGAVSAAAAAATPVPGLSDALVLGAIVTMLVRIALAMGVPLSRDNLVPVVSAMVGSLLTTLAIRLGAGELLKLIPGVGSVTGGFINAGLAGSAAYGLGCGFVEFLTHFQADHHRMPTGEELRDGFSEFWKNWPDKFREPPKT